MIQSRPQLRFYTAIVFAIAGFVVASCGSYQQASYYDNDGIYTNNRSRVVENNTPTSTQPNESNTYSNYFRLKANQYQQIPENEIFTDVESYSSAENDSINAPQLNYQENNYNSRPAWGDNPTSINISVFDNGWNNWGRFGYGGFGVGFGGFYNGWGIGWNRWNRWNRWNNWGWGGYGGFNNWGWGGFNNWGWGYGTNLWWCPPRYAYNAGFYGYQGRDYAYNRTRRGYYNRNAVANTRSRTVGVDRNSAYRTSRSTRVTPRYNSSSRSNTTYRSSRSSTAPRTSTYRGSGTRTKSSSSRPSYNSRSNQSYRSSSPRSSSRVRNYSPSRSSSGYRSSSARSSSRGRR